MRLAWLLCLLSVAVVVVGCREDDATVAGDACERADHKLRACGVMLPLVSSGCVGLRRVASECVNAHADGCDELATIFQRVDACLEDQQGDGGDIVPEGIAIVAHDASRGDALAGDAGFDARREASAAALDGGEP